MESTTTLQRISEFHASAKGAKRTVAEYILSHTGDVVFMTLEEVAAVIGVSPATITRTASAMGFMGYPDLQEKLRAYVKSAMSPVERLREREFCAGSLGVRESFAIDEANLSRTLSMNDNPSLSDAIGALANAEKVYLLATRSSYCVLSFISVVLSQIRGNVVLLSEANGIIAEQLMNVTQKDVVLAFSLPRYSRVVVDALQYVKRSGCRIVTISDSSTSPLSVLADIALYVPYESGSYFNSNVSSMALANALITGVNTELGEQATQRLHHHDELLKYTNSVL